MGTYLATSRRAWGASSTRRTRAYTPDDIATQIFSLDPLTVGDIEAAERAVSAVDRSIESTPDSSASANLLLYNESVASTRLLGAPAVLELLVQTELDAGSEGRKRSNRLAAVVQTMKATQRCLGIDGELTVEALLEIHAILFEGSADATYAGRLRRQSRRCAGNGTGVGFVPTPGEHVRRMLEDACAFANRTDLPPVLQAAIVYAQIRTIRPFLDGNARMSRILAQMVLRARGLTTKTIVPISLALAADAPRYEAALDEYRFEGSYASPANAARVHGWISTFALLIRTVATRITDLIEADMLVEIAIDDASHRSDGRVASDRHASIYARELALTGRR
jgi:Fic family protein